MKKNKSKIGYKLVIVVMLIASQFIMCSCGNSKGDGVVTTADFEDLKDRCKVVGEYRQDEVENMLISCISMIYAPTSEDDFNSAVDEIRVLLTDDEYNSLKDDLVYDGDTEHDIQEIKVYYCSSENSTDGRAREYVDLKVGNDNYNIMYLIEFTINGDGKIFQHKVWRY